MDGFENDVEMYGAQTWLIFSAITIPFENDVEMYGAQTDEEGQKQAYGLRMM